MTKTQWITMIIPVLVPILVAALKRAIVKVPSPMLPIVAIALGAVLDTVNVIVTGGGVGPLWGLVLGGAGVAVREVVDQLRPK